MTHSIEVKVDTALHTREPRDESERLTWAVLDTALGLLREYAVRVTLSEIRLQASAQGISFPADEEVFRLNAESGGPDAAKSYMDLAPVSSEAAQHLAQAFQDLFDVAMTEASEGMGFALAENENDLPPELAQAFRDAGLA